MKTRSLFLFAAVFFLGLGVVDNAVAQVESGTISGVVLDNSGAVISGARITVSNTTTGQVRTTVANASGEYSVPFLAPSTYDVEAAKDGFGTVVQRSVILKVDQILALTFTLKPGTLSQKLEVTTE